MSRLSPLLVLIVALPFVGDTAIADDSSKVLLDVSLLPEPGTVSNEEGLVAWNRIHDVFTHPRCLNCHVGNDGVPLWTTGSSSESTQAHGMWIKGGNSRMGAETMLCNSCHQTSAQRNTKAHAAPHTGMIWRLAPTEFQWTDQSSAQICEQVRDPERNGGRDEEGLIEHILHDASVFGFISWGFDPGPGRSRPPGSLQSHLEDMATWTSAGMPCPDL
ncbi:MAG: hypothetical protein AAF438_00405 [Pseudomonadota bacterium]